MKKNTYVLSIQPKYAKKIFDGSKKVELRKNISNIKKGDNILIYVTSPNKELFGSCVVTNVLEQTPSKLWEKVKYYSGISKKEYDNYYNNHKKAQGIYISKVKKLCKPVNLESLRKNWLDFSPPQSFFYFRKEKVSRNLLTKIISLLTL